MKLKKLKLEEMDIQTLDDSNMKTIVGGNTELTRPGEGDGDSFSASASASVSWTSYREVDVEVEVEGEF